MLQSNLRTSRVLARRLAAVRNSGKGSDSRRTLDLRPKGEEFSEREKRGQHQSLIGSLRISCLFDRGTFGVPICQHLSTSVNICQHLSTSVNFCQHLSTSVNICQHLSIVRTFFPNLSEFITFAATPLVLTPFVRNQSSGARGPYGSLDEEAAAKAPVLGCYCIPL